MGGDEAGAHGDVAGAVEECYEYCDDESESGVCALVSFFDVFYFFLSFSYCVLLF